MGDLVDELWSLFVELSTEDQIDWLLEFGGIDEQVRNLDDDRLNDEINILRELKDEQCKRKNTGVNRRG